MVVPILNFRLKNCGTGDELIRRHLELVELVTRDGQRWISETRVGGQSVLRMMVISYLTGEQQLADLLGRFAASGRDTERAHVNEMTPDNSLLMAEPLRSTIYYLDTNAQTFYRYRSRKT